MPERAILARSPDSSLFGKCDVQKTVNVSESTDARLTRIAASLGLPVGEYLRSIIEINVWGSAAVLERSCARSLPLTSVGNTGD